MFFSPPHLFLFSLCSESHQLGNTSTSAESDSRMWKNLSKSLHVHLCPFRCKVSFFLVKIFKDEIRVCMTLPCFQFLCFASKGMDTLVGWIHSPTRFAWNTHFPFGEHGFSERVSSPKLDPFLEYFWIFLSKLLNSLLWVFTKGFMRYWIFDFSMWIQLPFSIINTR